MVKKTLTVLKGIHGSALIIALVTTVVLATLAIAIISITMVNLTANQADALNNDAYYAAESGVTSALEQLKSEVLGYYGEMIAADSTQYGILYENFFTNINDRADDNFNEPLFGDGLTTETTFTTGGYDPANDVYEFLVSSTATAADNSQYRVDAKLYIMRVDISAPTWLTLDDVAYKIGGTFTLNAGYSVINGGNVIASALYNPKNIYYSVQPPGKFILSPGVSDTINDCLEYPSYTNPVLTPTYTVTTNNMELNGNTINPATGKKLFEEKNAVIVSNPGISFKIGWGDLDPSIVIYKKGSGTLTLSCSNTNHTIRCYSDDKVVVSNGPVYADIFCRGDITTSGNFHGDVISDGNCINTCNTYYGTMIVQGSINANGGLHASFFAEGPITINNGNQGNNVIYSKTKISVGNGNYQNVVMFSGGAIDINGGSSLTGAIIAKNNVTQNQWLTLSYSRSAIEAIMNDANNEFFFSGGEGGEIEVEGGSVIVDQEVTAIGRL